MPEGIDLISYPNPFNSGTTISIDWPEDVPDTEARIEIYNVLGQRIRSFVLEPGDRPGRIDLVWDGTSGNGEAVVSGTYFVLFRAGEFIRSIKVLLLR